MFMKRSKRKHVHSDGLIQTLESRRLLSAGTLAINFGSNGYIVNSIHATPGTLYLDGADYASDVQVFDSKIVVAGSVNGNSSFGVACYSVSGAPVLNFGSSGQSVIEIGSQSYAKANSTAIDAQGRILVGGRAVNEGSLSAVVARLNPQGSLDTTFGSNGLMYLNYPGYTYSEVSQILPTSEGFITIGRAGNVSENNEDWVVSQFYSDGTPDFLFGVNGSLTVNLGGLDQPQEAIRDAQGNLFIAGASQQRDDIDSIWKHTGFWAVKITSLGSLDSSFGNGGIVHLTTQTPSFAAKIALGSDQSLFIAGPSTETNAAYIAHLSAAGQLDASYGEGGIATLSGFARVIGLQAEESNSALVVGYSTKVNSNQQQVATLTLRGHLLPDGKPDVLFGLTGTTTVQHSLAVQLNQNAAVLPDGGVLLVGSASTYSIQGKTSFGFLTAKLNPDKPDSHNSDVVVPPTPAAKAKLSGKTLTITGTSQADTLSLSMKNAKTLRAMLNGKETLYTLSKITKLVINAGDGSDAVLLNDVKIPAVIHGGAGDDTLVGGYGNDTIYGDGGADAIDGSLGSDKLYGGNGNDYLFGGTGISKDYLYGESGDDTFRTSKGGDVAVGSYGNDSVVYVSPSIKFGSTKTIENL